MLKKVSMLCLLALAPSILFAGPLDGTKWKLREKGVRFWASDELIFINNQLMSESGRKEGFKAADYNTSKNDSWLTWNAVQTNDKGEKMEWYGVSNGAQMDGSYTLIKLNGESAVRQWQAELSQP